MTWPYHRKHGEMTDINPVQVDAVVRLFCGGGRQEHNPVVLGELIRTVESWQLGRGPYLELRVYDTRDEIVSDQTKEREMRDELLADVVDLPTITADRLRRLSSTTKADRAARARAFWHPELSGLLHRVAIEAKCPADGCRMHRKATNVLAAGDRLDFEVGKDNPTQKARPVPDQYGLGDVFAPVWEIGLHRLTHSN